MLTSLRKTDQVLFICCQNGQYNIVEILIKILIYIKDTSKGVSPLTIVSENGHESIVQLLIENCAKIKVKLLTKN